MPELLSIHGRCPRCSQVLTVPAGQLQGLFRCARCQYRVLGATLMEEARVTPPRLSSNHGMSNPGTSVVGPFEEGADDQHTRLHLPASSDEEPETVLPAQLVDAAGNSIPPRVMAAPLRRFGDTRDDPDDQQTRLHVAGSFDPPRDAARGMPRPERMEATVRGVPSAPRLSRFGDEPDDSDDQATRLHLGDVKDLLPEPSRGQTTRGMPAPPIPTAPPTAPIARFDAASDDDDDQNTRLQVPINYEEGAGSRAAAGIPALPPRASAPPPRASLPDLRSPVAPRLSLPTNEPDPLAPQGFGLSALKLSRVIDDWVRERHAVLLITLAALCAIIAPVFDVLLGNPRHGATVIAANLALFFLWALAYAWLGKLVNDSDVWDYRIAFSRLGTSARLALADLRGFNTRPLPLRWRVTADVSGAAGLVGLGLASVLTLTHLVLAWPEGTALLFLLRLLAGSAIVLSVIAAKEATNVPAGISPAPDVTAPAVTHFPAIVDLSLPLTPPPNQAGTPLHQVLEMLSQWLPQEWPNRDSYVAALERHFLERTGWARVERERRLGAERGEGVAHLILDEALLLEVVRGFDADVAERVSLRMRRLAKVWRGKPALIVVFDASRAELLGGAGTQHLEALHQAYPMLAVRMPSARVSLA
jgi:hypothetical protein